LSRVVELGNAADYGLKVRFGHPNASGTALGTFLGRARNFTIRPDSPNVVRADIQLDTVAKDAPEGNLYDYVLRMATKNPDMFGTSIVFKPGEERDPAEISPEDIAFETLPVATILELMAVDIVDDPAANEGGLFSRFSAKQIAGRFTSFLDDNPQVWEVIDQHPEIIAPFIERYRAYKNTNNEVDTMPPESTPDTTEEENQTAPEASAPETPETPAPEASEPEAPETPAVPEASAPEDNPEEQPEAVAASNADRVAELGRIESELGAEALAEAVRENLTFEQASAKAFARLRAENEALRKANHAGEFDAGAEPLTGGENAEPVAPSKYAGKMGDAAARRAEYFEKKMTAGL